MRKHLLFLISASLCYAGIGSQVPLTVTDRSGFTRTGNVMTGGIAMAESFAVLDVRKVKLTASPCNVGANIDSHLMVTERWHGDPTNTALTIKWIVADVPVQTLAALGSNAVCLADRGLTDPDPGTAPTVAVNSSDACPISGVCTSVNTGITKYWIRNDSFNLFDRVQRVSDSHDYITHSTSGGLTFVTAAGTYTSSTVPTATPGIPGYTISTLQPSGANTANESGANLKAIIRVGGALWSGSTPKFTWNGDLYFYGGDGMWTFKFRNIFSEDMFDPNNLPTDVVLNIPTTLGNSLNTTFGTAYGNPATSTTVASDNVTSVRLIQYDHGSTVANVAPTIGGTTTVNIPWNLCNDSGSHNAASGQACSGLNETGFRVTKATTTQATGSQSDGWMSVDDGVNQVNIWVRDHWQKYPVEFEQNGTTLAFHPWPKHGDTPVDGHSQGDLTMIFNYKYLMALAGQQGFGHLWPFAAGAAMNMTPITPNPNRPVFNITTPVAGQPVRLAIKGFNYNLAGTDIPCNGVGCNWVQKCVLNGSGWCTFDVTKAVKTYDSAFTGTWVPMNSFHYAMWTGSTLPDGSNNWPVLDFFNLDGSIVDPATFGAVPAGCAATLGGTCKVGTMDIASDSQSDSFARAWEISGNFTTHAAAAPGSDASRWRDTLLFINPTYYVDTSLVMGHAHHQDVAGFPRQEAEITNYFNNLYKQEITGNIYGIYYGLDFYGLSPSGFGNRYFAINSRRRYDIAYPLQFMASGDPFYFHRMQAFMDATEVEVQHPPQAAVTSAYNGVGIDHTGSPSSNTFWGTKHYTDVHNDLVAKLDGSPLCTQGWGASIWFPIYSASPSPLSGVGKGTGGNANASVNRCPDGQTPAIDYPTTNLRLIYDLNGDPRAKDLLTSVGNEVVFASNGGTNIRTLNPVDEQSGIYSGGAFGRAFGGGNQASVDAAEVVGNGTVNYISVADAAFAAGIQIRSGINVWSQNPTGLMYDDGGIGPSSATPSANGHMHYGSHYFTEPYWAAAFAEYVSYKTGLTGPCGLNVICHPSFASGHADQNIQTALNNVANGILGYFNTSTRSGGLYAYQWPGRVVADSYAITADPEQLKYIGRALKHFTFGADSAIQSTGCTQTGSATVTGDTPTTPPTLAGLVAPSLVGICASPTGSTATLPVDLSAAINPNATTFGAPDIHNGGQLAVGLRYLMQPAGVLTAAQPNVPPSFVLVPAAAAANAPLRWVTNVSGTPFTFDLALRIAVSSDFGTLSVVTPISGDFSLTVVDSTGANVSGVTVADSAGDTYTCSPTCTFKTPTQMWPPAAGGGAGKCLVAPAPPSINFTAPGGIPDNLNNKDNRVFFVSVPNPGSLSGEYQVLLTYLNCSDPNGLQVPVASLLSMSTGNFSLVNCTAPCNAIGRFLRVEQGSIQYFNVSSAVSKIQADSSTRFALLDPNNVLYRGGTTKTIPLVIGKWAAYQSGGWESETSYVSPFFQTNDARPLSSASAAYFYNSPNYTMPAFVSIPANPINLTFSTASCTNNTPTPLHQETVNQPYLPTVQETTFGCGAGTPNFTVGSGSLPPGLVMSPTGVISGTATVAGIYSWTVHVTGLATLPPDASQSVTINAAPLITTATPLPQATTHVAYTPVTIANTGGTAPFSWTVISGALPTGISLGISSAVVSGTATSAPGLYSFTIQITDASGATNSKAFTMNLVSDLATTTVSLPAGVAGVAYSQNLTATGGVPPYMWTLNTGSIPAGLTLASNGSITGTPTHVASYTFTAKVTDSLGSTSITPSLTIPITSSCTLTTTSPLPGGTISLVYTPVTLATNLCVAPFTFAVTVGTVPTGLTLHSATGVIDGTPTGSPQAWLFTVTVTDAATGSTNKQYQITTVNPTVTPGSSITSTTMGGAVKLQ